MPFRSYVFTVLLSCIGLCSLGQKDSSFLDRASQRLYEHTSLYSSEKVYLHFDKPYYYAGDTIWFKAYTVIGERHQLSNLSKLLYCELINSGDSIVNRYALRLTSGLAWNNFVLPRSVRQVYYRVRAYTNWMRNFDPGYFFNQQIRVFGPRTPAQIQVQIAKNLLPASTPAKPDIQFFPEGGELVNGVRSRVAFKSVGVNGAGQYIEGNVTDNDGKEVAAFALQHWGMGVFAFTPQQGKSYRANILFGDGSKTVVDLPAARDEGFTFAVNNSDRDSVYLRIAAIDKTFLAMHGKRLYVIGRTNGKIYYAAETKLSGCVFSAAISKKRFPSGIAQFTLFSPDGEPLNERVAFIDNNDKLNIVVSADSAKYGPARKVKLNINAKNDSGKAITGSFSVAVINETRIPVDEGAESTILANLLLTSDLKGYIEQPNYYFTNVDETKRAHLDVLMLTQGYRKFEWKQVLGNQDFQSLVYPAQTNFVLQGIVKTSAGKPVVHGKVTLAAPRELFFADTTTDAGGNFTFDGLNLSDTSKIVIKARKQNDGSNVSIFIRQPDFPPIEKTYVQLRDDNQGGNPTQKIQDALVRYREQIKLDSLNRPKQLKEVVIKDKPAPNPDQYNGHGTVYEFDVDMKKLNKDAIDLNSELNFAIPGMFYDGKRFTYELKPVAVYIDEIIRSADDVHFFKPEEIQSVRLIDATATHRAMLILTTKRYAGTDTSAVVKLKEVVIKDKKTPKPDIYNHYGIRMEYNVDMNKLAREYYADTKTGIQMLVPGLIENGGEWWYEGVDKQRRHVIKRFVIDGFDRTMDDLNYYSAKEIDNIRIIDGGGLPGDNPVLVLTTKKFAGTDTIKTLKLKEVQVKSTVKKKPDMSASSNLLGGGNADQVIMGDDLPEGYSSLSDCLAGRVHGVSISNGKALNVRMKMQEMAIIVDGNKLSSDHLDDIPIEDIYSIEVLRSVFSMSIYGSSMPGAGALVITTRRTPTAKYATSVVPAGLITYPFLGYHKARVFYSPKYDRPGAQYHSFDSRTTIYWNPNILTDKNGNAFVEFFNADTKGTYRIVIEGIDDEGNIGRTVYRYKVE